MKTKKYVLLSMLVAQAMILFIVESAIPTPFMPPGAKLGLANIITVLSLYIFTPKETLMIILLRIFLSAIILTNLQTMIYSLSGALTSFTFMLIVKSLFKDKVSPIGVSCVGAVFHSVGQLFVASFMFGTLGFFYYLPLHTAIALFTGFFIGCTTMYLLKHFKKLRLFTF
ncbi:Gx transporter family protein [Oceanirhabdus sp. W0125-5]|uniref:Gx transporter family protein n=1 Tax=Oceanirhabdus sp. W0125-5 TaxID=2999116 RepID=UPI0022F336CC|nr:Gx transporter family protein [Oceanirhabdus sp. W0125-5]WBW99364.1 Gx transporter family protein [Oceanirhabdus sp. W0125-5]